MWVMFDKVQNDDVNILIRHLQKLEHIRRFSPMISRNYYPNNLSVNVSQFQVNLFETMFNIWESPNSAYMFECWSIKSCDRRLLNSRKVTFTQILYETKLRFVFFFVNFGETSHWEKGVCLCKFTNTYAIKLTKTKGCFTQIISDLNTYFCYLLLPY